MIIGKRVRLRSDEHSDLASFVTWLNDREVTQYLLRTDPMSTAQEEKWFERMITRPPEEMPLAIEVSTPGGWTLIGNTSLFDFDWINRCAEIGIFIGAKEYWSQGYGTEAMQLMLKHGFEDYGLNRIYLRVYSNNPRGQACYSKAGFKKEGVLRQAVFRNGQFIDVIMMGILSSEWFEKERV
jgi:RimJ/RimL family protein N-acetyltransferase